MELSAQLNYFATLADRYLQDEAAAGCTAQIDALRRKHADKRLYLAVTGEFNSGKTTFINALLRMRLLKENVMPTTACATYIERGPAFRLCVRFIGDGEEYVAGEDDCTRVCSYVQNRFGRKANDIRALIELLTSDQDVARHVTSLHLLVPTQNIPPQVVIIDTPGFNPGDDALENHFEIAQHVVAHVADAALVLMPSGAPFSASTANFMGNNLSRYLHRCVFVLTQADRLHSDEERASVQTFVEKRLKADLKLSHPAVFSESAVTVLPVHYLPPELAEGWTRWQRDFKAFETYLWQLLSRQKETILTEHLLSLSLTLTTQLQEALTSRQQELERQQAELEKKRIAHIRDVTESLVQHIDHDISKAFETIGQDTRKRIAEAKQPVLHRINTEMISEKYYNFDQILPKVKADVQAANQDICQAVNQLLNRKVQLEVDHAARTLQEGFKAHYAMFPTLHYELPRIQIPVGQVEAPFIFFEKANNLMGEANTRGGEKAAKSVGTCAAIGVAIGSIIPGLGSLVGGIIGAGVGAVRGVGQAMDIGKQSTPQVKAAVWQEVDEYFDSISNSYQTRLDQLRTHIGVTLQRVANRHVEVYGHTVEDLISRQEAESQQMSQDIGQLKEDIRQLEDLEADNRYRLNILNMQT